MKVEKTRIDSKVSIHFCIYEYSADASLQTTVDNVTNKPICNINYILGKTLIHDISPKAKIRPSSTVKRNKKKKKKITSSCYFSAQGTVFNRISCLVWFSVSEHELAFDEKHGWWRCVCFYRGEPRVENYQGIKRDAFLWSDNQVRRQLF